MRQLATKAVEQFDTSEPAQPNFEALKQEWLLQIAGHHDLHDAAFKVAYVLSTFLNRESCEAWPSLAKLAKLCGKSRSAVCRALKQLEAAGFLKIENRKKPGSDELTSNRYVPIWRVNTGATPVALNEDTCSHSRNRVFTQSQREPFIGTSEGNLKKEPLTSAKRKSSRSRASREFFARCRKFFGRKFDDWSYAIWEFSGFDAFAALDILDRAEESGDPLAYIRKLVGIGEN